MRNCKGLSGQVNVTPGGCQRDGQNVYINSGGEKRVLRATRLSLVAVPMSSFKYIKSGTLQMSRVPIIILIATDVT